MQVTMTVNGTEVTRDVEPRLLLVHFLRDTLGLTGTHWGCDTSNCGTCVVLMDGEPVKSCTVLAAMTEGHDIRTVEEVSAGRPCGGSGRGRGGAAPPPPWALPTGRSATGASSARRTRGSSAA